ncbi:aminotransferase class III-fold pyridoxal phosphate-dependent enzyme [Pseudomonas sp. LP_7_YM]|uniref:aminotransferase class III-fold pyridoxal phosphate-dependent enzyme n=1 Tax=Pseudomonas sp. LP_7_YM TaxID=2485137 RepID=UPI001060C732|nr:aminotransferase class III-fold pyridoxal phosphate-dependent enzyme [Pseudomonas sp. LP_7_YM]TDV59554.1 aminotransferase class III [Pseudomonas sp. LP_7_YM]
MNLSRLLRNCVAKEGAREQSPLLSPLQRLRQRTDSDQSGLFVAEQQACAAAMTLARQWGERHRRGECGVVVACGGRFDELIESMVSDFRRVPFNDLLAMEAAVDSRTVAIILEPMQGDSVVTPASHAYVQGVERLCRELNILLILHETRGTRGQSGGLFCEDTYNVRADILVLGDYSSCSPRCSALLARGHACTAEIEELQGYVHEPISRPTPVAPPAKALRQPVPTGLMA